MKKPLKLLLCLALVSVAGMAFGADGELKTYEMEEVVVTGSKLPRTPGNVTQKIEIISAAEIEDMVLGNGNLAEILSYSPGNFSNVLSRAYPNWGSSGGLAHTYKGYMVDGLPVDSFVEPMSLDPWAFERIEDQRGSASVLYPNYLGMDFAGNQSSLAGTANFILKERVSEPRTAFSAYYGSYYTLGARVFHQKAVGNLHFFVGGHHEDSDYTSYRADPTLTLNDPQYEKTKFYMRGTYFLEGSPEHRFSVYAHRTWHDGDEGRPNRGYAHRYTTLNTSYVRPVDEQLTAQVKVGHRNVDRTWESDFWEKAENHIGLRKDSGMYQEVSPADVSLSLVHGGDDLLTVGTDFQYASYQTWTKTTNSYSVDNQADAMHLGVYVQEEQKLDRLILRAGGRFNYLRHDIDVLSGAPPGEETTSWNKLLWSTGVRYNQSRALSLFANIGTSFKAPSLKSIGGTIPLSDKNVAGVSGHLPNPDLDPESGMSVDVGANYQVREGLSLGFRGFLISLDDQIVQNVVNDLQSQDINAGQTQSRGLETEIRHNPGTWWQWHANYTFTDTEIDNDLEPDKDGAEMNFVPKHMANLGVDLFLPDDLRASISVQVFSSINESISNTAPNKIDGYELVNARIEKRFAGKDGRDVRVYLEPYNITNNDFDMPWGFQDPGFSANAGLTVSF